MKKVVTITMDLERGNQLLDQPLRVPASGEFVASVRKDRNVGQHYRIVEVQEVRRQDPTAAPRFRLRCQRVSWPTSTDPTHTWYLRWYPRRRTRAG